MHARFPTASKTCPTRHRRDVVLYTCTIRNRRKQERLEFSWFLDSRSFSTSSYKNIAVVFLLSRSPSDNLCLERPLPTSWRLDNLFLVLYIRREDVFYLKRTNRRSSLELHVHTDNHRVGYFTPHTILQTFWRLIEKKRKTGKKKLKKNKGLTMYTG